MNAFADPASNDFRFVLRHATRDSHTSTEAALAWFDRDPVATLPDFLSVQRTAYTALLDALAAPLPEPAERLVTSLLDDLAREGAELLPIRARRLDPLAAAYVAIGARLGTAVLRRRCAEAGIDPLPAYFLPRDDVPCWRSVCDRLSAIDPGSPQAARVIRDSHAAFDLFRVAAAQIRERAHAPA
ncbi:MAG: hypothetical protein KDK24_02095 [Pseudooceanicola sp.]|nr:hypothetical protein [Pseudooceanicola sp.]